MAEDRESAMDVYGLGRNERENRKNSSEIEELEKFVGRRHGNWDLPSLSHLMGLQKGDELFICEITNLE